MHKIIRCLIVITISLFMCILSSCKKGDKMFKFEATLNESSVQINKPFSITMKTTNISNEDYYYEGSSTVVGAVIYLKKGSTIIRPNDVPVTKDFRKMIFKSNDCIEKVWYFEYDLIKEEGCYDLYIEFFDEQEVIKNYICIK